ncbi:MAG: hypothetical protein V3V12_06255 [Gammaproteobacteria bacterium]
MDPLRLSTLHISDMTIDLMPIKISTLSSTLPPLSNVDRATIKAL